jgi:hypothetical protein
MSETRPVPRRESPWGITGENHPEPKAHRCNDRVEDVIQVQIPLQLKFSGFHNFFFWFNFLEISLCIAFLLVFDA